MIDTVKFMGIEVAELRHCRDLFKETAE